MDPTALLHLSDDLTDTLNGQPAFRLQPGVPLKITADDWTAGQVLNAEVCQQGPNHSRLELRWYVKGSEEPRMVITMGYLPEVRSALLYDLKYLDANTLFLPRTPGRLKSTSLGERIEREEISHAELMLVDVETEQSFLVTRPALYPSMPPPVLPETPFWMTMDNWLSANGQANNRLLSPCKPPFSPKPNSPL